MSRGGSHLEKDAAGNTNASASVFGWEFQINAAIVLLIDNLKEAVEVRVEGASDDIEITLFDGSKLLGQAKANFSNDPGYRASTRFKDALKTLKHDSLEHNCKSCLYVTNDLLPFGKSHKEDKFHSESLLMFDELSPKLQNWIRKEVADTGVEVEPFVSKMGVFVLYFYGENERTKTRIVNERIADLLSELRLSGLSASLLRRNWAIQFLQNATEPSPTVTLSKADFVWPIIVLACRSGVNDSSLDKYPDDLRDEVMLAYEELINDASQKFALTTVILSDFEEYRKAKGSSSIAEDITTFVSERYTSYFNTVGADALDPVVGECVTKMIVEKVLLRRKTIISVKEGVNLED